jgi:hypothetical protein
LPAECQTANNRRDMAALLRDPMGNDSEAQAHHLHHVLFTEGWRNGGVPLARQNIDESKA